MKHNTPVATASDVAEEFGVSEKTVRRWTSTGLIHGRRIGPRLIRYNLDEVRSDLGLSVEVQDGQVSQEKAEQEAAREVLIVKAARVCVTHPNGSVVPVGLAYARALADAGLLAEAGEES